MDKKPSGLRARWKTLYHRSSIQLILSIAFTAVAVIGMLFLGMALLLRFFLVGQRNGGRDEPTRARAGELEPR